MMGVQSATVCCVMGAELEEGKSDPRFPGSDRRYAHMDPTLLPLTESLKTTVERFMPLWIETIAPAVKSGKNVIIAAHGNSLRVSHCSTSSRFAGRVLYLQTEIALAMRLVGQAPLA